MSEETSKAYLTVRVEGPNVGPGRIGLEDFLDLASEMMRAVERVGILLTRSGESTRTRRCPTDLKRALSLDMVGLTEGANAAVIYFDRSESQTVEEEVHFGDTVYSTWLRGMHELVGEDPALPSGFDVGVLMKMRDVGRIFTRGISQVEFSLNRGQTHIRFNYTARSAERIRERIARPLRIEHTIEGRLLMDDFRETGPTFRVHPAVGEPILCQFEDTFRDQVYENILKYVRVRGRARRDSLGNITAIEIADIEPLGRDERVPLEDQLGDVTHDTMFWEHRSVEQLAAAQGAGPIRDVTILTGGWPGELDDGFEAWIGQLRESEWAGDADGHG